MSHYHPFLTGDARRYNSDEPAPDAATVPTYHTDDKYRESGYEHLHGPDGFGCVLTEPEDRTWGRDGADVVAELNRLHARATAAEAERDALLARAESAERDWQDAEDRAAAAESYLAASPLAAENAELRARVAGAEAACQDLRAELRKADDYAAYLNRGRDRQDEKIDELRADLTIAEREAAAGRVLRAATNEWLHAQTPADETDIIIAAMEAYDATAPATTATTAGEGVAHG